MIRVNLPDGRAINVKTDNVDLAKARARKYLQENPLVERGAQLGEEDVSAIGDIGRGVAAGLVSAVEGVATLPSELSGDEQSAQELREFFAKYKPDTSTDIGEAARFIAQFAAPGGIAAKAAKGLGSIGKVGAFGAADIAATTPDVETLGDLFESGPTKRIDTEDLTGAELAAANLSNRLKVGAEGAALILGVPAVAKLGLQAVGATAGAIGRTDFVRDAARAIKDPNTPFHDVGVKPDLSDPGFVRGNIERFKKNFTKYAKFQGGMPDRFTKQYDALRIHEIAAHSSAARQAVEKIDNALTFVNKNEGIFNNQDKSRILNTLNDFLFAEESMARPGATRETIQTNAARELKEIDDIIGKNLSKSLFTNRKDLSLFRGAEDLRGQIDGLSDSVRDILRDPILNPEMQKDLIKTIGDNKTFYGMRLYRALNDTNYSPTAEQADKAIKELVNSSRGLDEANRLNEAEARAVLNGMLQSDFSNAKMAPKDMIETPTLSGVSQGMLRGRRLDNLPAVRDFLGEYTGAKDVMMRNRPQLIRARDVGEQEIGLRTKMVETVDIMSKQIAKARYYKNLVDYNEKLGELGQNKFLFDQLPANAKLGEYSRIGAESSNPLSEIGESAKRRFGPLAGKYVRNDYKEALENGSEIFDLSKGSLPLYSTFLGLKGLSQIAKTVYSPITQIRNATTAGFFALANGNIGNSKSLANSFSTVFSNLNQRLTAPGKSGATLADRQKYYNELIDLGVINTNAKIGEFESLLNDAVETTQYMPGLARKAFKKAQGLQNGFSAKLYQASDDVWKTYSFEMELGRLQKAFTKDANTVINVSDPRNFTEFGAVVRKADLTEEQFETLLKREAAEIVKDTVPNYARVPEYIKRLRQMPFGNFVAFPAEMIRTGGNILGRSIKELASDSPEIRAIGMKRLLGFTSVNVAIPQSLAIAGTQLTGANEEQVQAYKRSMAADWDRNSTLIPIATDKDGNITDLYNFSYTNPYDYLKRPFSAVYNAVNNGITKEEELSTIAFNAMYDSGAEFFSPFMSESIVTEKIADMARNKTSFGRPIWRERDPLGTKFAKGFAHLSDGIMPGISPIDFEADVDSPVLGLNVRLRDFPRAVATVLPTDARLGVTKQGFAVDPAQEFTEALTGVKSLKPRIDRVLYYRALEAGRGVRDASGIFTSLAKQRGSVDAEKLTKAYITANEQRFKALRDLNMAIEDAKTLGLSTAEIVKPLKDAKTPNLNFLMAGRFNAFFPSSETISIALQGNEDKLANPIDLGALGEAFGEFQGSRFRPQAAAEAQAAQAPVAPPPTQPQPTPQIAPTQPSTPPMSLFDRGVDALRQIELNKLLGID
jgi:hypothetical protein